MTILERLSLIKAGYNRKEIDAMIEEEKNNVTESAGEVLIKNPKPEEVSAPALSGADTDSEKGIETSPNDVNTDSTEAALNDALAEIEKLKSELKTAQDFNTQKDASETVNDDAKTVEDIVRSFM